MAVLESTAPGPFHGKVVIADLAANGVARSVFQVRNEYYTYAGPGRAVFPPREAYGVRGSVYFVDGYGTVFRLGVDGRQEIAARFPIGLHQQEVSFAVRPDGCELAASVLTMPTVPLNSYGEPDVAGQSPLTGEWKLGIMKANFGGATEVLHTWSSDKAPNSPGGFENVVLLGWDSSGPIAVAGSSLTVPDDTYGRPIANADFYGGKIANLTADGTVGPALSLPGCTPAQVSPQGDITCYVLSGPTKLSLSVIRSSGSTELGPVDFALQPEGIYAYSSPTVAVGPTGLLAISGQVQAANSQVPTLGHWRWPDGSGGDLPSQFYPQGWVDKLTIFGRDSLFQCACVGGVGDASLLRIGPAQQAEDLQFGGDFVGMLSA